MKQKFIFFVNNSTSIIKKFLKHCIGTITIIIAMYANHKLHSILIGERDVTSVIKIMNA